MATISLYTTAPSLTQADEILDTHINILPFSPDLVRLWMRPQILRPAADINIAISHHNWDSFPNDSRGTAANP
jgi:hypothetical protein